MPYLDVTDLTCAVPGGGTLFEAVSFRVANGEHVALVGANGTGKSTLLRTIADPGRGAKSAITTDEPPLLMDQFVAADTTRTVREFLLSVARPRLRDAAATLAEAERAVRLPHGHAADLRYADALAAWEAAGGYEAEVLWDTCTGAALGLPLSAAADRRLATLSGGERKRLALEALFRTDGGLLLLDEPDNFLDIPAKRWLEDTINASRKAILFVSHDRELLANTATKVVTLEAHGAWTHEDGFATYHEGRAARLARLDEDYRRYRDEHEHLVAMLREFKRRARITDAFASRAQAAETRLKRFERTPPPARPQEQKVAVRLEGSRTGKRALTVREMSIPGLVQPFSAEILFGERVGLLGRNGVGKSHLLRAFAGEDVGARGSWSLGARVVPGYFSQFHETAELRGRTPLGALARRGLGLGPAIAALRRYELADTAEQPFETLSGGQQARLQILVLELGGANFLLLDEPTDNLDLVSAEALEEGLERFEGTVLAVTHDRWFMRTFDRFWSLAEDGTLGETLEPVPA